MRFIVEGKVQGKARARTFFNHNTGRMQSITPEQTKSYEELIRWSYKTSGGKYLGEQPIELSVKAFLRSKLWQKYIVIVAKKK